MNERWGTSASVPAWSSTEAVTPEQWTIPHLFTAAGAEHPEVTFARFDHGYDAIQEALVRATDDRDVDLLASIRAVEAGIEADGVPVASYVAPGNEHTVLPVDELYTLEVEGTRFLEWFVRVVAGDDAGDVSCVDCGTPAEFGPS